MAKHTEFIFNAGDLKRLLAGADDKDSVIIETDYTPVTGKGKTFEAVILARLTRVGGPLTEGDDTITGCPIPPNCP